MKLLPVRCTVLISGRRKYCSQACVPKPAKITKKQIIDDWFYRRKIKHKINVPYPENNSLTADFVVENYWKEN